MGEGNGGGKTRVEDKDVHGDGTKRQRGVRGSDKQPAKPPIVSPSSLDLSFLANTQCCHIIYTWMNPLVELAQPSITI